VLLELDKGSAAGQQAGGSDGGRDGSGSGSGSGPVPFVVGSVLIVYDDAAAIVLPKEQIAREEIAVGEDSLQRARHAAVEGRRRRGRGRRGGHTMRLLLLLLLLLPKCVEGLPGSPELQSVDDGLLLGVLGEAHLGG